MTTERSKNFVFVGLGNPGVKYELTRHNIGYLVIKNFARKQGWGFKEENRFSAYATRGVIKGATVHLLLPTTYMNLSGMAVKPYLDYYKLGHESLLVVADDVALSFGKMRLKTMGSPGGHNGLKSIEAHLGTQVYARLRMGVGSPEKGRDLADYVLQTFNHEETEQLVGFVEKGTQALQWLLEADTSKVMNVVNTKEDLTKPPAKG